MTESVSLNLGDSFMSIESWEDYCKECIENKRMDLFKKKLNQYINYTKHVEEKEVMEYVNRRLGEFAHEDMLDKFKSKKKKENADESS